LELKHHQAVPTAIDDVAASALDANRVNQAFSMEVSPVIVL
jgi:hypothetical protein